MSTLSPTDSAAASTATGGGDIDFEQYALNNLLQQMYRNQFDADDDYSIPVVSAEMAKIMANAIFPLAT